MTGTQPDVLIVGAGPVGMVLACELLQQGVAIRLIDQQPEIDETDPHSRGILVWPRSLELLRRIEVSDRMIAAGHASPGVGYYSEGRLLGTAHLHRHSDSPYNFVLTLPQRKTERVLRERLAELGGVIERGVTLADLDNSEAAGPMATLKHLDGTTELVVPRWLIGADGPGSIVRELLGIGFDGDPLDVTYAIGDMPLHGNPPANAGYFYSKRGVVALVPLGDGVYRVAANVPHRTEADGDPPAELIQQIITERAHVDVTVGTPLWTRSFRPRLGLADQVRSGRCFLVGDAAHVISPAGGQGMNVGLQDAVNLGWKLGGVVTGRLDESILDSYGPERQVAGERMSRTSAAQGRFAIQVKPWRILRRDAIFLGARLAGVLQRVLVPLLSQTDVNYGEQDTRPIVLRNRGNARPGQRVPLFAAPDLPDGTPALDRYRHTVLLWPGRASHAFGPDAAARLRARVGGLADVLDLSTVDGSVRKRLRATFGRRPAVAVVRPDGHLAAVTPVTRSVPFTTAADEAAAYLASVASAQPEPASQAA